MFSLYLLLVLVNESVMLVRQFRQTVIGSIIELPGKPLFQQILKAYISDYVYMSHPCVNTTEHWVSRLCDYYMQISVDHLMCRLVTTTIYRVELCTLCIRCVHFVYIVYTLYTQCVQHKILLRHFTCWFSTIKIF